MKPGKIILFGSNSYLCRNFSFLMKSKIPDCKLIGLDKDDDINPWLDSFIKYDLTVFSNDLKQFNDEYIINFASNTSVDDSFKNDEEFTDNNIKIAMTLSKINPKFGIHISTTSVEKMSNPYAISKYGQELILQSCVYENWNIIRLNNLYGAFNSHCLPVKNPKILWNVLRNGVNINMVYDYQIIKRNFLPVQVVCDKLYYKILLGENFRILSMGGYECELSKFIDYYCQKYKLKFNIVLIENRKNEDYSYDNSFNNIDFETFMRFL